MPFEDQFSVVYVYYYGHKYLFAYYSTSSKALVAVFSKKLNVAEDLAYLEAAPDVMNIQCFYSCSGHRAALSFG